MPTLPHTTPLPVTTSAANIAASPLERALRDAIRGEVRFDALSRTIYSTDASLYEIIPSCVVLPRDAADVRRVVEIAAAHNIPISARGAGTGINGGSLGSGITLDFSKYMTKISDVDAGARSVRVQPGVVLDDLNATLAEFGLTFPPDVAPSSRATIGGMIANNSCGAHSIYYGRTVDYIEELTVVLADGSLHTWHHHPYRDLPEKNGRTPQIPLVRRDSNELTVGQVYNPPKRETEAPAEPPIRTPRAKRGAETADILASSIPQQIHDALIKINTDFHNEIIDRYPRVLRRNGGYALDRLCLSDAPNPATILCGSEGTLALVVEAKLRLVPKPRHAALLVIQFDSVFDAVGATPAVLEHDPAAVELLDDLLLCAGAPEIEPTIRAQFLTDIPKAILVCEAYAADEAALRDKIETLDASLSKQNIGVVRHRVFDRAVQAAVWEMRKRGFGLIMCKPGDRQPHEFIEDAAVDPRDLRAYLEQLTDAVNEEGCAELGYYAHASVGVIHVRPVLNLKDDADVRKLARIAERARELVAKFGGAFTGEHGDGLVRSWSLEKMYGPRIIEAFRLLKNAFDPHNLLNPGKIIDPPPITENLRYRNKPRPNDRELYFDYGEHKDIAGLAGMCTGVGQCRQKLVGTMCPSYMATLEEQHTTRARAVALRAALHGEGLLDGLDDPALHDVMDLCLSCKACKTECPTGVDMARLKAEWLAQTYKKSGVPTAAKFIASVPQNLRLAAISPTIANFFQDNAFTRALLEMRYGLDRRVPLPPIAKQTFRQWFATHDKRGGTMNKNMQSAELNSGGPTLSRSESEIEGQTLSQSVRDQKAQKWGTGSQPVSQSRQVVYFADTWTNFFWPQVGIAAVRLLEAIGCEVIVPRVECCGRPMISKGLLDEARQLAQKNAAILGDYARRGVPLLGSEPSCILTFIDEFPHFVRTSEAKAIAAATKTVEQFLYEHRAALAAALRDHPNPQQQTEHRQNPNPLRQAGGRVVDVSEDFTSPIKSASAKPILFHGHCHQKALIGTSDANALLALLPNRTTRELNTGCCGMAGSFGHEKKHYDIAKAVGEQRLFPAVRANPNADIVVCGFSCREQIQHHCNVTPKHVLEALAEALTY